MADFPSPTSAYGVWSLREQRDAVRGGNWPTIPISVDYLIVAGGGGGGAFGGGGGAGGLIETQSSLIDKGVEYTITVGAGGAGSTGTAEGISGENSSAFSDTAIGGGGGGTLTSYNV